MKTQSQHRFAGASVLSSKLNNNTMASGQSSMNDKCKTRQAHL